MHAVFTRNVAANPLIHNNYSWGNLRVRYVFCSESLLKLFNGENFGKPVLQVAEGL